MITPKSIIESRKVLILISVLVVCADARARTCQHITDIEGDYHCVGECVVRSSDDGTKVVPVSGEVDVIHKIAGTTEPLYRIEIAGSDNFREVEIGALAGSTLRAATARVSDGNFPVLEEYLFEHDDSCAAVGYTKIVRNPSHGDFKACSISCSKEQ